MTKAIKDQLDNRLATIEGHIKAVRKMLAEDKGCVEIITQLNAIEKALRKAGIMVIKNHMDTCIDQAVENGDKETVSELKQVLEMYL